MTNKYTPSVNIVRDLNAEINYIATPNTQLLFDHIISNYLSGAHSFNLIGSYGTGKSSFLWALERHLNKKTIYFTESGENIKSEQFEYLPIIGNYQSITDYFASFLKYKGEMSPQAIIEEFKKYYLNLHKKGLSLLLVIDEFGKFLEYATNNSPEKELYFIQLLAEFANDFQNRIVFLTALHKGFTSYSFGLSQSQMNEWEKVKGRFKEITFNEPVEHLLYLASRRLDSKINNPNVDKLLEIVKSAKIFPLKDHLNGNSARSLEPFDIISAAILTKALQKYGQNERSLFQFIDSNDYLSINNFDKKNNPFYNLSCVYDYLLFNHNSFITSKYNPDYLRWKYIGAALDRVDSIFDNNSNYKKIIKVIGLLSLLGEVNGIIDIDFLRKYSELSLGIKNSEEIIHDLEKYKIISYSSYYNRFKIVGGSDIDIEDEMLKAQIPSSNFEILLKQNIELPHVLAKGHFYRTGTPRLFSYILSTEPIIGFENSCDGIINIVFSKTIEKSDFIALSIKNEDAILYCLYKEESKIHSLLIDIEKIKIVINKFRDDLIVVDDLKVLLRDYQNQLSSYMTDYLLSSESNLYWVFKGREQTITNGKKLNRVLSNICDSVYYGTPIQRNELINRSKLSGAIQYARKNLIEALIKNQTEPNLGFDDDKFPAHRTIYLTLLKATGIHYNGHLQAPNDPSYQLLWDTCTRFIEKTKAARTSPLELIELLQKKPFNLKYGFIEFWVPLFLFINQDEFALFYEGVYHPDIDMASLELLSKQPQKFEIKAFDVSGIKLDLYNSYQEFLNIETSDTINNEKLINIIKPFLVFYLSLPQYGQTTKRISKNAIVFREAIKHAKDPEKAFFEDIPAALGYDLNIVAKDSIKTNDFIKTLQSYVKEIRTSYEELINRIERYLVNDILGSNETFPEYKARFQRRFQGIKKPMLTPKQMVFYQRIMSAIDVRNTWISSISEALLNKPLDKISDKDEYILYERLQETIDELDNLCKLAKHDIDPEKEDLYQLEISSINTGSLKKTVRISKERLKKIEPIEQEIRKQLTTDKSSNIILLSKLIQEQMKDDTKG